MAGAAMLNLHPLGFAGGSRSVNDVAKVFRLQPDVPAAQTRVRLARDLRRPLIHAR